MITRPLLRSLRNDLPMPFTFRLLGDRAPYAKTVEGRFRFVCPHCGDLNAVLNPRNNLAHCFNCRANINNIDLLIALGHTFREPALLVEALTHASYLQDHPQSGAHNQRLEFLGDSVLHFALTDALYRELPTEREGGLSRRRAALVRGVAGYW